MLTLLQRNKIIWGKCEIISEVVLYSVFKKKITQTEVSFFEVFLFLLTINYAK